MDAKVQSKRLVCRGRRLYKPKGCKVEVKDVYALLATHKGVGGITLVKHVILSCNETADWWLVLRRSLYRRLHNMER
jgi:hypothetical protein